MDYKNTDIMPMYLNDNLCCVNAATKTLSNKFYKLARTFMAQKMLSQALDCYCDAFLLRNLTIEEGDDQFIDFFKVQFTIYQLGKKNIVIAQCEGDMIYDLIQMEWERIQNELELSPFEINEKGLHDWYKNIEIDFPWIENFDILEM
ncbi:MAG: hypothetical protein JJE21_01755 [Spirochaetaceae bacterium]|nr:hypothetical protein [Spirochaetaceae bacterium]